MKNSVKYHVGSCSFFNTVKAILKKFRGPVVLLGCRVCQHSKVGLNERFSICGKFGPELGLRARQEDATFSLRLVVMIERSDRIESNRLREL